MTSDTYCVNSKNSLEIQPLPNVGVTVLIYPHLAPCTLKIRSGYIATTLSISININLEGFGAGCEYIQINHSS